MTPIFQETAMSSEKSHDGIFFFEIDILILKYILDHSESIHTKKKKFFDQKFMSLLFFSFCDLIFRKNGNVKS